MSWSCTQGKLGGQYRWFNKPTRIDSHVHVRLVAEVDSELQRDAHVVLHPPHLAVERDALLAEGVGGGLVLEGVDAELLAEALARGHGGFGQERLRDVDALVAQHVVGERHHGELDLFYDISQDGSVDIMSGHGVDYNEVLKELVYEINENMLDKNDDEVRKELANYENSMLIELYVDLHSHFQQNHQALTKTIQKNHALEKLILRHREWPDIETVDFGKTMASNWLTDKTPSNKNPYIVKV